MKAILNQRKLIFMGYGRKNGEVSFFLQEHTLNESYNNYETKKNTAIQELHDRFQCLLSSFKELHKQRGFDFEVKMEKQEILRIVGENKENRIIYTSASEIVHPKLNSTLFTGYHFNRTTDITKLSTNVEEEIIHFVNASTARLDVYKYPHVLGKDALATILEKIIVTTYENYNNNIELEDYLFSNYNFVCIDDPSLIPDGPNNCTFDDRGIKVKPSVIIDESGWKIKDIINNGHFMNGDLFGQLNENHSEWGLRCLSLLIARDTLKEAYVHIGEAVTHVVKNKITIKCSRVTLRIGGEIKYLLSPFVIQTTVQDFLKSFNKSVSEPQLARGKHILPDILIKQMWR
jgi:hypothetical protein